MALIIPRGWLRNRRPAPFDRRTPLIIPEGGEHDEPMPAWYGGIWTMQNSVDTNYYLELYVAVDKAWFLSVAGSLQFDWRNLYIGPLIFSNTYLISQNTPYKTMFTYQEIWPLFIRGRKFSDSGIGEKAVYMSELPRYYWSDKPQYGPRGSLTNAIRFYSGSYPGAVPKGDVVNENGVMVRNIRPPAQWGTSDWVHLGLLQSNPQVYPTRDAELARGKNAIICPLAVLEKGTGNEWTLKDIVPKTTAFTKNWYENLEKGSYG